MLAMLQVDDANHAPAAHQGHREKRLVAVFRQFVEKLEPWIVCRFFWNRNRLAMLRDPSGNALPDAQFQPVDHFRMWILRSPQHELIAFQNVNEAGVALDQRRSKFDHTAQNVVKSVRRTQPFADFMQYIIDLVEIKSNSKF